MSDQAIKTIVENISFVVIFVAAAIAYVKVYGKKKD